MTKKIIHVAIIAAIVAAVGIFVLNQAFPIGPAVLTLALFPLAGLLLARRPLFGAIPDMVFGAIDTGLLTIPAVWGGMVFGVSGAITGGVIGDAITDAIAGFFEGHISEWLRTKGIVESREAVSTSLGKMTGCLMGCGLVLTVALLFGIKP